MNIRSKIGTIGTVSAAVLLSGFFATTANAALVSLDTKDTVLDVPPILVAANLLDPTSYTGTVRVDWQGNDLDNVIPNSRSPYDGTAFESNAFYHSVSTDSTATYSFNVVQSRFAFMWGSPDDYNTLKFFLNGAPVGTFTGLSVIPPGTLGLGFVDVVFNGLFDEVVFGSTGQDAFEFTNLSSTPVPLPAAAWLLLSGLAGLGVVSRRKKV